MKNKKGLVLGGILLLGIGFAAVSTTLYINGDVNISANEEDFDVVFTKAVVDSVDESDTAISADGKTINYTTKELEALNDKSVLDFEITNNSRSYDAEVSIECTSGEKGEYYQITKEITPTILAKTTETGKVEVEKIKSTTEEVEEAFTCTLNAVAKERTTKKEEPVKVNKNIVNNDLECLKNREVGSCEAGTEIRYMVNDSLEKTFYVLHDDGATITMQQRENTIGATKWYSDSNDTTKGPLTVLSYLEETTNGWNNVNTLNYAMGTTLFNGNPYTGCSKTVCTTNEYILENRSAKARMVTIQELATLGCTGDQGSCPMWIHNYLRNSISHGGTADGDDWGYWTMSTDSSNPGNAWYIYSAGFQYSLTTNTSGARAVIEISK